MVAINITTSMTRLLQSLVTHCEAAHEDLTATGESSLGQICLDGVGIVLGLDMSLRMRVFKKNYSRMISYWRCEGSSVDDVEHMIYGCTSLAAERQKNQSLFARGRVALADFFEQDPIELAAFVHGCFKACNE